VGPVFTGSLVSCGLRGAVGIGVRRCRGLRARTGFRAKRFRSSTFLAPSEAVWAKQLFWITPEGKYPLSRGLCV
jgi:hypothetical protein